MKKFLAGLVSLLMLSTAFAEPTITHLGYTAYLGSSNELYLQDPTGTVRVLRYPIADILSITDTVVYCRAQDGKLLSIALDGSQSLIIAEAPTDEQVNALTAKSSYTLTDGVLTVIRDNRLQKEPTVGQVPLVSGEIAEDLTSYYAYSEQVPTVMALGVLVDKDLSILCAGGFMVQLLPGATDAEIDQLEKNINTMPSVTELLHAGKTPEDMMQMALAGFTPNVLDERTVQYQCDCSAERTKEMLLSLGRAELVRMRDEDPNCEVVCHFCHSKYQYDLNALLAEYDAQAAQAAEAEHPIQ